MKNKTIVFTSLLLGACASQKVAQNEQKGVETQRSPASLGEPAIQLGKAAWKALDSDLPKLAQLMSKNLDNAVEKKAVEDMQIFLRNELRTLTNENRLSQLELDTLLKKDALTKDEFQALKGFLDLIAKGNTAKAQAILTTSPIRQGQQQVVNALVGSGNSEEGQLVVAAFVSQIKKLSDLGTIDASAVANLLSKIDKKKLSGSVENVRSTLDVVQALVLFYAKDQSETALSLDVAQAVKLINSFDDNGLKGLDMALREAHFARSNGLSSRQEALKAALEKLVRDGDPSIKEDKFKKLIEELMTCVNGILK